MPGRAPRSDATRSVPDAPEDPNQPTTDRLPRRRRGGQELPDDEQDRPEQNAGYDAAVRGESTARPIEPTADLAVEDVREGDLRIAQLPDELPPEERPIPSPDDRAEREVIAEVRRRERRR
jgi:hypothetical protein